MTSKVQPKATVERQVRKLGSKDIASVKVKWKGHSSEETAWELEDKTREEYPHLFYNLGKYSHIFCLVLRMKFLYGGEIVMF